MNGISGTCSGVGHVNKRIAALVGDDSDAVLRSPKTHPFLRRFVRRFERLRRFHRRRHSVERFLKLNVVDEEQHTLTAKLSCASDSSTSP